MYTVVTESIKLNYVDSLLCMFSAHKVTASVIRYSSRLAPSVTIHNNALKVYTRSISDTSLSQSNLCKCPNNICCMDRNDIYLLMLG